LSSFSRSGGPGQGKATGATARLSRAHQRQHTELAARNGNSGDWRGIAIANNIDDPLRLRAGALIDLNVKVSFIEAAAALIGLPERLAWGFGSEANSSLR